MKGEIKSTKRTLHEHCETKLYTLKLLLLDNILENLEKLGILDVLNTSCLDGSIFLSRMPICLHQRGGLGTVLEPASS